MKKTQVKWRTKSFINNKPIEVYTREEINTFFFNAWDKGFRAIGYTTKINTEFLKRYQQESLKYGVVCQITSSGKVIYKTKRGDLYE